MTMGMVMAEMTVDRVDEAGTEEDGDNNTLEPLRK